MHYSKISMNVLMREVIDDNALDTKEVQEVLIRRWMMDALYMVPTTEELTHQIVHLVVTDGRAELPETFKLVQAVVGRKAPKDKRTRRVEELVQWALPTSDPEISLEVRAVCSKCKKYECTTCSAPIIEVDVDRVWEMGNPHAFMKRFTGMGTWGNGAGEEDSMTSWTMLRPMTGHFSSARHFLSDCPNLNAPYEAPSFFLELPFIKTSFMEGELMLSYLGRQVDNEGDLMVPDQVSLLEGIKAHVMHKWFMRLYTRSVGAKTEGSQQYLQAAQLNLQTRDRYFGVYRSEATQPDPKEFAAFMKDVWLQRLPDINYDTRLGTPRRGQYSRYNDLFKT